jgi:hypothetical protein
MESIFAASKEAGMPDWTKAAPRMASTTSAQVCVDKKSGHAPSAEAYNHAHLVANLLILEFPIGRHCRRLLDGRIERIPESGVELSAQYIVRETDSESGTLERGVRDEGLTPVVKLPLAKLRLRSDAAK